MNIANGTISKKPQDSTRFLRPMIGFSNARSAFKVLLETLNLGPNDTVLLPSYIGWSKREGSGVFDPIRQAATDYAFYRVERNLGVDVEDLRVHLREKQVRVLVLIHYYGYPQVNAVKAAKLAREAGALVLEDEAHALFSDLVGGVCGRTGDVALFSFHKMFPVSWGGALVINSSFDQKLILKLHESRERREYSIDLRDYDLSAIAQVRRHNASVLHRLLAPLAGKADPMLPPPGEGVVPQTLPVLIRSVSRDTLYEQMNSRGFGVVSLYHTLISEISPAAFPESYLLARQILNLPIHQDTSESALEAMVSTLSVLTGVHA